MSMMKELEHPRRCSARTRRSSRSSTSTTSRVRTACPAEWREYFDELRDGAPDVAHAPVVESFRELARSRKVAHAMVDAGTMHKQVLVLQLIGKFRVLGLYHADLDPLKRHAAAVHPGPRPQDLRLLRSRPRHRVRRRARSRPAAQRMKLRDIIDALRDTYCRTFGAEYMDIADTATKRWVQGKIEPIRARPTLRRRAQARHPRAADRRRDARALPAHEVRRPEALLAARAARR